MFENVLGPEKNGYVRAYSPRKGITDYFGGRPTKIEVFKQIEASKKEANDRVEQVKREANERVNEI